VISNRTRAALVRFLNHAYDFRPNCAPLSSITIINFSFLTDSSPSGSSRDCSSCSEELLGEIAAEFNDITFFVAPCCKSQVDLSYLCLQSQKVAFQHAPVVPQEAHVSMESTFSETGLKNVRACSRSHASCCRERPGHHNKPRKNGGVFKKFRIAPGLW